MSIPQLIDQIWHLQAKGFKKIKGKKQVEVFFILTRVQKGWNSDLAKDISWQSQHLRILCNWYLYELYCWSEMILHFINQCAILFTGFVYLLTLPVKNAPKKCFPLYLEMKILASEAHLLHWNLEEILPDNYAKKGCQGNFYFCFFQKLLYDYIREKHACSINSQCFTACQKYTCVPDE